jgi:hypothetical protein
MIGFLKENDLYFWLKKLNGFGMLNGMKLNYLKELKSKHSRPNNLDALSHHFWIKIA